MPFREGYFGFSGDAAVADILEAGSGEIDIY